MKCIFFLEIQQNAYRAKYTIQIQEELNHALICNVDSKRQYHWVARYQSLCPCKVEHRRARLDSESLYLRAILKAYLGDKTSQFRGNDTEDHGRWIICIVLRDSSFIIDDYSGRCTYFHVDCFYLA